MTDFSDEQIHLGQPLYTRIIGLPTMEDFGTAASETDDNNVIITLDLFKQAQFSFPPEEYLATGRNLVAEHSEALAVALGNGLVDAVAALVTDDFAAESIGASEAFDYTALIVHNAALNSAGVPEQGRFGWVNSEVAQALRNDEVVMANFDRNATNAYAGWKNIEGFETIWEFPALPGNSVNLTGFFAQQSALVVASRVAINSGGLTQIGYPGNISTVTDPVSGLSVISNQWVTQDTLVVNDRLILLFGCAKGNAVCGRKHVTA